MELEKKTCKFMVKRLESIDTVSKFWALFGIDLMRNSDTVKL